MDNTNGGEDTGLRAWLVEWSSESTALSRLYMERVDADAKAEQARREGWEVVAVRRVAFHETDRREGYWKVIPD